VRSHERIRGDGELMHSDGEFMRTHHEHPPAPCGVLGKLTVVRLERT
jgi:hypothetical protein